MKTISYLIILMLSVSLFQSCTDDENMDPVGEAPELPAEASFVMPFDGFEDSDTTGLHRDAAQARTVTTFRNWFYSATNVVVWNAVLTINLAIPVGSFREAFNHTPTYQGDGIWLWAYTFNINNATYVAELRGQFLDAERVEWDMKISQINGFAQVQWYTGIVAVDGSYAEWTLNHQPNNPQNFIGIEYNRDLTSGNASIRYTNIIPNSADKGDYIEYREYVGTGVDYNRNYDVYKISQDNMLEIQWNTPANNGRVKNPVEFNDSDWHCWDGELMDMDCN